MKTIGFPVSLKENEFRRALLPSDLMSIKMFKLDSNDYNPLEEDM